MSSLTRERKERRALQRRMLREHRRSSLYLHSYKEQDIEPGVSVWGFWGCPRCRGVLDDLSGATDAQIGQLELEE
jgi:hypothetical protein